MYVCMYVYIYYTYYIYCVYVVFSKKLNLKTFLYESILICSILFYYSGVFKTLSNIYNGIFFQTELMVFSCVFSQKLPSQMF